MEASVVLKKLNSKAIRIPATVIQQLIKSVVISLAYPLRVVSERSAR
jgi:antitoxin component of MazEF toxin-antitoxin module